MADIGEFLKKQRRQAEERDAERRAQRAGAGYLNLISISTPTEIEAMRVVSEEEARAALAVPVQIIRKKLLLAVYDPSRAETKALIDKLKTTYEVSLVISSKTGLEYTWRHYAYVKKEGEDIRANVNLDAGEITEINKRIRSIPDFSKEISGFKNPLISQMLEVVMGGAIALHASDIHLEPIKGGSVFRLRIDGILHTAAEGVPTATHKALIMRVKLLSGLKLNINDEPQDGRFTVDMPERSIEIRTSIIPAEYGEAVVMRLLDPKGLKVNLEDLGWRADDLAIVTREIAKPNGLILNTGPTGSGKTTTLYAFLRHKVTPEIKVITVEDPVEYHLAGISQTQVAPDAGYTFASGLRSILRQDPDVILVGEIRDRETAETAMNASLTGHLVFTTLHTNSAVGAIPRLVDLGVNSHVMGPALTLVIAQRLVRVLCKECKKTVPADKKLVGNIEEFLSSLPKRVNASAYASPHLHEAVGCAVCGGLGYKGRTSVFELFPVTKEVERLIYEEPNEIHLAELARKEGMVTMQEDGILKALQGITTLEEVERVTGPIHRFPV